MKRDLRKAVAKSTASVILLHNTPKSPHREHMGGERGGGEGDYESWDEEGRRSVSDTPHREPDVPKGDYEWWDREGRRQGSDTPRKSLDKWSSSRLLQSGGRRLSRSIMGVNLALTEAMVSLHDTPNSPHREHMEGAGGGEDQGQGAGRSLLSPEAQEIRDREVAEAFEDIKQGLEQGTSPGEIIQRLADEGGWGSFDAGRIYQEYKRGNGQQPAVSKHDTSNFSHHLDLVDSVEQPEHFTSGDDVVPTGKPKGDLGKRPPAKGADDNDDIFPETKDPDSGDAVAHVAFPDNIDKDLRGVINRAGTVLRSLLSKKSIAEDVNATMNDLSQAIHELDEVAEALSERERRLSAGQ